NDELRRHAVALPWHLDIARAELGGAKMRLHPPPTLSGLVKEGQANLASPRAALERRPRRNRPAPAASGDSVAGVVRGEGRRRAGTGRGVWTGPGAAGRAPASCAAVCCPFEGAVAAAGSPDDRVSAAAVGSAPLVFCSWLAARVGAAARWPVKRVFPRIAGADG